MAFVWREVINIPPPTGSRKHGMIGAIMMPIDAIQSERKIELWQAFEKQYSEYRQYDGFRKRSILLKCKKNFGTKGVNWVKKGQYYFIDKKMTSSKELQEYVAYCPSCGGKLQFDRPFRDGNVEAVSAKCICGKKWSFIFDLDESGTFGVMSFQCDNEDRILST